MSGRHSGNVLIIIDVQNGFLTPATRHIPAAVAALQNDFATVFVTRFENPPNSPYRTILDWHDFTPGTPQCALAFTPRADARIRTKTIYSAVTAQLLAELKALNADTVHLCGIATDNCVLKTATDLFEAGVRPVVLAQACASHGGLEAHRAGLAVLKRLIGAAQIIPA